jgi:predicted RNase H-like nuclease
VTRSPTTAPTTAATTRSPTTARTTAAAIRNPTTATITAAVTGSGSTMRVLGIDGTKRGWVVVALQDSELARAHVVTSIADVISDPASVIGVDIPLGESTAGARQAEARARQLLGARHSTVFTPPPLSTASAPSYEAACSLARELTGKAMSRQAWHLLPKMIDAAPFWQVSPERIREIHPECSFAEMNGAPLTSRKRTAEGRRERIALLARQGVFLEGSPLAGCHAPSDDVIDAAAVAWSARRVACGRARCMPDPPERDSEGRPIAIWC